MEDMEVYVFHIAQLHGMCVKKNYGDNFIDISNFSYKEIKKHIEDIVPDLTVFMSFRSLFELVIQQICKEHNLKHFYLEHGMFSNDTLRFRSNKLKKERKVVIRRQLKFILLSFQRIMFSSRPLLEFILFKNVYFRNKFYLCKHDHYLVYSERSFDCLKNIFKLSLKEVEYIGYPIFNDYRQKKECDELEKNKDGILYVHQPLISDGLASISYDEEKQFLLHISEKLKTYGKLTVLLHPRSNVNEYKRRFADTDIEIIQSPNNYKIFANKAIVIGHYSTALLYGLYFDKRTIILNYPSMHNDSVFNNIFQYVEDIDKLNIDILTDKSIDKEYILGTNNTFEHISERLKYYAN